jgi:hypothetical protein
LFDRRQESIKRYDAEEAERFKLANDTKVKMERDVVDH